MSQANAMPESGTALPDDGVAGAFKRLWQLHAPSGPLAPVDAPQDGTPDSGVTYRGYLGASGGTSATWMSEQQLKETQALLRMAAAAGRLGAWSVEIPDMAWTWSDEVKAIHGVAAGYVPNAQEALAFYTPASQQLLIEAFIACAEAGKPFDLELQLLSGEGRDTWIRAIGEAERDAMGKVTHVRGAIQDVSKFRMVAEEARRTAERLTETLESLSDGYVLLDRDWCFQYVNPAAQRILRRDRTALAGRCLLTEFPETAAGKFLERCMDAIQAGQSLEFEKYYRELGIWVYMKIWPTDAGLTLCIRDDTERVMARREILRLKAELSALAR